MFTLADVFSSVRRNGEVRAPEGWPPGLKPRVRYHVPDDDRITLPKSVEGLGDWIDPRHAATVPLGSDLASVARAALLSRPTFVAPLPTPSSEWFAKRAIDTSAWGKRENPRFILNAVAFEAEVPHYGLARTLVVENALGFGASQILFHEEIWANDRDEFSDALASQIVDATDLRPVPEGTAVPWTTVVMLLNDESIEHGLPPDWKRQLKLVAGLYSVELTVYANAWAKKAPILHEIRTAPPNGLLVADGSVPVPDAFIGPFQSAKPNGYADVLGTRLARSFEDHVVELGWHLRVMSDAQAAASFAAKVASKERPADWKQAAEVIRGLQCEHFKLTDRADRMLDNNPYPDPARMVDHVRALAGLARKYHQNAGNLGRRLDEVATAEFEIEIALFDSTITPNTVTSHGHPYDALPHVKVDDVKSPDKCGRVYFAMDNRKYVFIVDHIGLHGY